MPSNISNFLKSQLVLLFVVAGLAVQGQCYFHNLYRYDSSGWFADFFQDAVLFRGKVYISGTTEGAGLLGYSTYYICIDTCGNSIYQKTLDYSSEGGEDGTSILAIDSITLCITGFAYDTLQDKGEGFIAYVDINGNVLNYKQLDAGYINERVVSSIKTKDGIVSYGYFNEIMDSNTFLIKTDFDGNTLWTKKYKGDPYPLVPKNVQQTKDNGFLFGGTLVINNPSYDQKLYAAKTDSLGNLEWLKIYPNTFHQGNVTVNSEGGFLLVGNRFVGSSDYFGYIGKMDSAGNVIWERQFDKYGDASNFTTAFETADGNYIISGSYTETNQSPHMQIVKVSKTNGATIWSRNHSYYWGNTHDYINKLISTETGDILAAGFVIPGGASPYNNDGFVIKLDSCGYLNNSSIDAQFNLQQSNQTVSFTNLSKGYCTSYWHFGDGNTSNAKSPTHSYNTDGIYTVMLIVRAGNSLDTITQQVNIGNVSVGHIPSKQVLLYPNPTNELLNIELTNTQADSYSITDVTGRVVLTDNILSSKQTIHIANLSKGVYFFNVTHQGTVVATGKVFKE